METVDHGPPDAGTVRATVAQIVDRDPGFTLDAFLAEAHQAFWLVGRAHAQCEPSLCESVLSPDLAERERAAIEEECRKGTNKAPESDDASSGQLVSLGSDGTRDT